MSRTLKLALVLVVITSVLAYGQNGGVIRQDNSASIAKESGGNLATVASGTGATTVDRCTTTNTTACTLVGLMKQLSYLLQTAVGPATAANSNPISCATDTGCVIKAASGNIASGAIASGALASGAVASGAIASGAFAAGSLNSAIPDPCLYSAKTPYPFTINSATTTQIVAASSSNKLYVCSMILFSSVADNVAFVEDATGSCASPDAGIIGGTTTGAGLVMASTAGNGFTLGNGIGTIAKTASTNVNVCLITSTSSVLVGTLMGVLAP